MNNYHHRLYNPEWALDSS